MKNSRLYQVIITVSTAVLNWVAFYYIAVHFKSTMPVFMASIVMISILVHELGHAVVLERNGIKTTMFFAVILGGVSPMPKYVAAYKRLHWKTNAEIALAGVVGNLMMVVVAALVYLWGQLTLTQLKQIACLNGGLIFFNLLPFSILDGGRFATSLFNSLPENLDGPFAKVAGFVMFGAALLVTLYTPQSFLVSGFLFIWGLSKKAKEDDPNGSHNPLAMAIPDCRRMTAIYVSLVVIGLVLQITMKNWIA